MTTHKASYFKNNNIRHYTNSRFIKQFIEINKFGFCFLLRDLAKSKQPKVNKGIIFLNSVNMLELPFRLHLLIIQESKALSKPLIFFRIKKKHLTLEFCNVIFELKHIIFK